MVVHRRGGVRLAVGVAWSLALAAEVLGVSVRLRTSARLDPGAAVRVADVAVVESGAAGGDAARWGGVVLAPSAEALVGDDAAARVSRDEVMKAFAEAGLPEGRVAVSGSACTVRLRRSADPSAADSAPGPAEAEPEMVALAGPATVRTRIAELLGRLNGVANDDLKILFDEPRDPLLDTKEWGRRIVLRPVSSGRSGRVLIEVRVLSGERTDASRVVRADVLVRRDVLVTAHEIARHGPLDERSLVAEERWLSPGGARVLGALSEVEGLRAKGRLRAGLVLRAGDVEEPIAVRRGDLVNVVCVRGGVELLTQGRARADGRAGERIEVTLRGGREPFAAVIDGPGRVIVNLDVMSEPADAGAEGTG